MSLIVRVLLCSLTIFLMYTCSLVSIMHCLWLSISGQSKMMCFGVCLSVPQEHSAVLDSPILFMWSASRECEDINLMRADEAAR